MSSNLSNTCAQMSSRHNFSRRAFLGSSLGLAATHFSVSALRAQPATSVPLLAYVGTFSSPLRDVLPTQVDRPPGNGRGIHLFQVDRISGALAPAGIFALGVSPSCVTLNAAGTRLYSANETDQTGPHKEG